LLLPLTKSLLAVLLEDFWNGSALSTFYFMVEINEAPTQRLCQRFPYARLSCAHEADQKDSTHRHIRPGGEQIPARSWGVGHPMVGGSRPILLAFLKVDFTTEGA
jgi:hypothetical protein